MRSRVELTGHALSVADGMLLANVKDLSLEEALAVAGGHRSILGILKHVAGWSHVYHSYAFEEDPASWETVAWPRGRRDTIEPSQEYLDEIVGWYRESVGRWSASLARLGDADLDAPRPVHWGSIAPTFDIVTMVADHWVYHAGEINEILAIVRGEAWEDGEEVEENHISTAGHRVTPPWRLGLT